METTLNIKLLCMLTWKLNFRLKILKICLLDFHSVTYKWCHLLRHHIILDQSPSSLFWPRQLAGTTDFCPSDQTEKKFLRFPFITAISSMFPEKSATASLTSASISLQTVWHRCPWSDLADCNYVTFNIHEMEKFELLDVSQILIPCSVCVLFILLSLTTERPVMYHCWMLPYTH